MTVWHDCQTVSFKMRIANILGVVFLKIFNQICKHYGSWFMRRLYKQ